MQTKDPDFSFFSFHLNSDSGSDSDSLSSDKANVLFSSFNDVNDQFGVSLLKVSFRTSSGSPILFHANPRTLSISTSPEG